MAKKLISIFVLVLLLTGILKVPVMAGTTSNAAAQQPTRMVKSNTKVIIEPNKLTYHKNINAGKGYVTIKGTGSFTGTLRKKFRIAPLSIKKASVSLSSASFSYTGKTIRPVPTVRIKLNGKRVTLRKGKDYTVSYKNNIKPGKGKVVITGKGNYTGKLQTSFKITEKTVKVTGITLSKSALTLVEGNTKTLKATVRPKNAANAVVTWKSSDPSVATVDQTGLLTAKKQGTATITASCQGKKATCAVTVRIKGIITIIDDDGTYAFQNKLLPIVREKGISIATAVIAGKVGNYSKSGKPLLMTWDDIQKCEEQGAEVLCHTLYHWSETQTRNMSYSEIYDEYKQARDLMKEHGYDGDILVYSKGTGKVRDAQSAASKLFKCGIYCAGNKTNYDDANLYRLARYRIQDDLDPNPEKVQALVDKVRQEGGWMIWIIHSNAKCVTDTAVKNLSGIIDYAKAQNVEIVTAKEGFARAFITPGT